MDVEELDPEILDSPQQAVQGRLVGSGAPQHRRIAHHAHLCVVEGGPYPRTRDTWRYHPLLAEMLRAELATHRPGEAQELNRLAAVILQPRGDIAGAVRCLLAAGDTDQAFSIVFEAAYRRADVSDTPGIAAFVNLFPRELVIESASRMLTYALMLGLAGRVAEAHAWLQRAQIRIADEPRARAEDLATLDALRLLTFTVTAGAGDEIDADRRAVEAVEAGLDSGVAGARARINLVRGYLLVDQPGEASSVLRAGSPGDEIAALVLAPALAARIAVREGRLSEAGRQATAALQAAGAFGFGTHLGAADAHLAMAGVRIDRNELAAAIAAFQYLEEILQANQFSRVYEVLVRLEKVRVAAALDDWDEVFATLREAGKLIDHVPPSALRCLVDAAAPLAPPSGPGTPGRGTDRHPARFQPGAHAAAGPPGPGMRALRCGAGPARRGEPRHDARPAGR